MSSLYIFNPENDLALACGKPNFTPPPMARKIRYDLQMIPIWLMEDGYILTDKAEENRLYLSELQIQFPRLQKVKIYSNYITVDTVNPWGWSSAVCSELKNKLNIDIQISQERLNHIRMLSNRCTIIDIYNQLAAVCSKYQMDDPPVVCRSIDSVKRLIEERNNCIIKAPWSGSGRGVFKVDQNNYKGYKDWVRSIIEKQESVICEKYLNKKMDFAMEFYSDGHAIKYIGLSVFSTNGRFSYDESIVASEDILMNLLGAYVDKLDIEELKADLLHILNRTSIRHDYIGYFGIDMMVYSDSQSIKIMPCVELNLRTTMGHIACAFGNRYIHAGKIGKMRVLFHGNDNSLQEFVSSLNKPVIENGKLISGTIFLTPLYKDSKYTATITIV